MLDVVFDILKDDDVVVGDIGDLVVDDFLEDLVIIFKIFIDVN